MPLRQSSSVHSTPSTRARRTAAIGFTLFGLAWGSWGAAVPDVQRSAHASDAQLGAALLGLAAAAIPAMLLTGRLADRVGIRICGVVVPLFAAAWISVPLAGSPLVLAGSLMMVGALSGATDVAINTAAVAAERASGRPFLPATHALFSTGVVLGALAIGLVRELGAMPLIVFSIIVVLALASIPTLAHGGPLHDAGGHRATRGAAPLAPVILLGALCAAAFFIENTHQTWSAVLLETQHHTRPALSAVAPMTFAAATAISRFALQRLARHVRARAIVVSGALLASMGTAIAAAAPGPVLVIGGVLLAGVGTSVIAPSLLSVTGQVAPVAVRGLAVSSVTAIAYVGFLGSPPVVGAAASGTSLRVAVALVAIIALALAVAGAVILKRIGDPRY